MTIEEVANAYSIDSRDLMKYLRINVSPKTRIEDLRSFGITNSMVKEAAEALFIDKYKTSYGNNIVVNAEQKLENESGNGLEKVLKEDVIATFALMVLGVIYFFKLRRKEIRYFTLGISMIYLGFIRGGCICVAGSLQQLALFAVGAIKGNYLYWSLLFILPVLFSIVFGRIFCGYACPIGAWQQFLSWLGTKLPKFSIPTNLDKILKNLKYFLALSIPVIAWYTKSPVFQRIEPFSYLFSLNWTLYGIVSVAVVSIASVFISRPFCRYICPYGAVLAIFSRFSIYKIKSNDSCKNCKICDRVCETDAITKGAVSQMECIRCRKCIDSCKFHALK